MRININDSSFEIMSNGDVILGNQKLEIDKANAQKLLQKLSLFVSSNEDMVSFKMIPPVYSIEINKIIENIYTQSLNKPLDEFEEILAELKKLGFLKEKNDALQKAYKKSVLNYFYFANNFEELIKKAKKDSLPLRELAGTATREQNAAYFSKALDGLRVQSETNFGLFREVMHDFGVYEESEILRYYNDKIEDNLTNSEFGLVSVAKKQLMDLQQQVIQDAIEAGYLPPSDLPKFINPKNTIYEEKVPEGKMLLVKTTLDNKTEEFSEILKKESQSLSGNLSPEEMRDILSKEFFKQFDILKADNEKDPRALFNIFATRDNGLSYERLLEWAKYTSENGIFNIQKAHIFAINAIRHANRLSDIGILKTDDGENFYFTDESAKVVLFKNLNNGYNDIANDMITLCEKAQQAFNAQKLDKEKIEAEEIKPVKAKAVKINHKLFEKQKKEFLEFLESDFLSHYKNFGRGFEDFKKDVLNNSADEYLIYQQKSELRKAGDDIESYQKIVLPILETLEQILLTKEEEKVVNNTSEDSKKYDDLLNRFCQFNFLYENSSDEEYKGRMHSLKQELLQEMHSIYFKDSSFQKELVDLFENGEGDQFSAQALASIGINPYYQKIEFAPVDESERADDVFIMNMHRKMNNFLTLSGLDKSEDHTRLLEKTKALLGEDLTKAKAFGVFKNFHEEYNTLMFKRKIEAAREINDIVGKVTVGEEVH